MRSGAATPYSSSDRASACSSTSETWCCSTARRRPVAVERGTAPLRERISGALERHPAAGLAILAAVVLFWQLGAYGLWESTEARYAEIAARMVRSGDWITPRLNAIAHFDKPPFAYWASAAGMALLGIDELAARLPLALASLAALLVVYRAAAETMCARAAAFAFLILLSSPLWFALSRSLTTDLYLTLWIV